MPVTHKPATRPLPAAPGGQGAGGGGLGAAAEQGASASPCAGWRQTEDLGPGTKAVPSGMASRATLPADCIFYRRFVPRVSGRGAWPWAHRLPVGAMRKSTSGPARRRGGWKLLATLLALAGVAAADGAWVVWRGIYDVSAT